MKKLFAALMVLCMLLGSSALALETGVEEFYNPVYEGEYFAPVADTLTELTIGKCVRTSISYIDGDTVEDNFCTRYFEKTLNVKYIHDWQSDEGAYTENVNLMIAEAAWDLDIMPDVFTVNYDQLTQLAEAGMIADLTDAYEKYASPNLKGAMDSSSGLARNLVTFNGQMLAIPSGDCGENSCGLYWIRKDWVEKLGAKMPETLDELITLARRFIAEDPDGNGVDDTMGIWAGNNVFAVNSGVGVMNQLTSAMNAYPEYWYCDEEGKVLYGSVQPEMRVALEKLAGWIKEGVINPNFVAGDDFAAKVQGPENKGGTCGIVSMPWWNASVPASMVIANPEQVRWDVAMIQDANGVINMPMMNPASVYLVAKAGISDEKLEAIIKTMNLQLETDLAVGMNLYYSGTAHNPYGTYMMPFSILVTYYNQKALQGAHAIQAYNGEIDMNTLFGEDYNTAAAYKRFKDGGSTFSIAAQDPDMCYMMHFFVIGAGSFNRNADKINWILPATEATTATMQTKWATLQTMEDQTFMQILNGEKGIEAFDQFVEDWYRLGGTDVIAEKQAIVDAQKAK
ncbi:MAG: extracellular solute-binding protein [Clostridiales bacterium]|nr:extracellular solute-binding protein [Clostridiales bacterium]